MKITALFMLLLIGCSEDEICEQASTLIFPLNPHGYGPAECPPNVKVYYSGTGCVRCSYFNECNQERSIGMCSPANGVYCSVDFKDCPAGYPIGGQNAAGNAATQ